MMTERKKLLEELVVQAKALGFDFVDVFVPDEKTGDVVALTFFKSEEYIDLIEHLPQKGLATQSKVAIATRKARKKLKQDRLKVITESEVEKLKKEAKMLCDIEAERKKDRETADRLWYTELVPLESVLKALEGQFKLMNEHALKISVCSAELESENRNLKEDVADMQQRIITAIKKAPTGMSIDAKLQGHSISPEEREWLTWFKENFGKIWEREHKKEK